jgi:hypothetical protein
MMEADQHFSTRSLYYFLPSKVYNLIMDFINNHKSFFVAAGAVAAGFGLAMYCSIHSVILVAKTRVRKPCRFLKFTRPIFQV